MTKLLSLLLLASLVAGCVTDVTGETPGFDLDAPPIEEVGGDGKADTASTQVVFLNFGGGRLHSGNCSDAPANCSNLVAGTQDLAPFTVSAQWDRPKVVAGITRCVSMFFDDMDMRFVTTRPAAGPYTMMMIGAIYPTQLGFETNGGPYGRAPVDCGNENRNDIGFLLLQDSVDPDFYFMCRSIAHELGHTFGMVHTMGENAVANGRVDMMCESGNCGDAAANGSAAWDVVNRPMTTEVRACDYSYRQNTYARLMDTLGAKR
ncbi:MAG: hypothetical protein H0T42_19305 [Deltaproteobacteria bacterium]|nr:hypothetical protein [Deltaproteobacteria bacterium]